MRLFFPKQSLLNFYFGQVFIMKFVVFSSQSEYFVALRLYNVLMVILAYHPLLI